MYTKIEFLFGAGFDKDGHSISRDELHSALRLIKIEAGQIFGAYSLYQHEGGWKNSNGKLVAEDGYTLSTVQMDGVQPDGKSFSTIPKIVEFVEVIKKTLSQESVAVVTSSVGFQLL